MTVDELQIIITAKLQAEQALNKLNSLLYEVSKAQQEVTQTGKSASAGVWELTKAGLAVIGIYNLARTAFHAFIATLKAGFTAVNEYKMGVASLAAVTMSFMKMQKGEDPGEAWKRAKNYAEQLYPTLENISIASLMSGQQVNMMMIEFLKHGVALNTQNKQQVEAFRAVTNALFIATGGLMIERQIVTEINALMQGQIRAVDRLGLLIQRINASRGKSNDETKKELQNAIATGQVYEYLFDVLKSFQFAAQDFATVWVAVKTAIDTVVNRVLRGALLPAYELVMKKLQDMVSWANEHRDQLSTGIYRGWVLIRTAIDSASKAIEIFKEMSGDLNIVWWGIGQLIKGIAFMFTMLPGVLGTMLELIKVIKEAIGGIADYLRNRIYTFLTHLGERLEGIPVIGEKIKEALDFSNEIKDSDTRSRAFFARMELDWNNLGTSMEKAEEAWYNFYKGIHTKIPGASTPEIAPGQLSEEQQTKAKNVLEAFTRKIEEYKAALVELRDPEQAELDRLQEFIREKTKDLDLKKNEIEEIRKINVAISEMKKTYKDLYEGKLVKEEYDYINKTYAEIQKLDADHASNRLDIQLGYLEKWYNAEIDNRLKGLKTEDEMNVAMLLLTQEYNYKKKKLYEDDNKKYADVQNKKLEQMRAYQDEIRALLGEENVSEKNRLEELRSMIQWYGEDWGYSSEQIATAIGNINLKLKDLSMTPDMKASIEAAQEIFGGLSDTVTDVFKGIMDGSQNAKEAFRSFTQDTIMLILKLIAKLLFLKYIFASLPNEIFGVSKNTLFNVPIGAVSGGGSPLVSSSNVPLPTTTTSYGRPQSVESMRGLRSTSAESGGVTEYHFHINALDAESFAAFARKNRRVFQEQMGRAFEKNTGIRGLSKKYG